MSSPATADVDSGEPADNGAEDPTDKPESANSPQPADSTEPSENTEPSETTASLDESEKSSDSETATEDAPDDDRWQRFASDASLEEEVVAPVGRLNRVKHRLSTVIRHEWTLAAIAALALAAVMTWPVLKDPLHTIPHDVGDPLLITYVLAWTGHALWNNPGGLWDTSAFYPLSDSYAFTDTFLGYAPAGLIGSGTEAALLRYNLLYVFAFALAFFGAYVLFRQLGARVAGSAVAAAAFAYAPWKLAQAGHLQVLSVGGIVLALAMLARGHGYSLRHGYRPERTRWGWVIAGWLVATWQVSIGFGMGVPFAYFLAGVCVVAAVNWVLSRFPRVPWRVLAANAGGIVVFAGAGLLQAIPYFRVLANHPESERTLDYVGFFSPSWASFLVSPPESALWGEAHEPARAQMFWHQETSLLVGFTVLALAVVGLIWSVWSLWQRVILAIGVVVSVSLAMGTNFIDSGEWAYALLFEYLPGFDGLRTPGRLVLYTTLFLALLAAGTITHLANRIDGYADADRVDPRWKVSTPMPLRLAMFLPILLVLAEGASVADTPEPPPPPVAMSEADGPILVLPSDGSTDTIVQYWSVDGFPDIVNGTAGFTPTAQQDIRDSSMSFPSAPSVEALRQAGINTVIVVRDRIEGTPWQNVLNNPTQNPSVTVIDYGPAVVFQL